jgi:hypothetical protein
MEVVVMKSDKDRLAININKSTDIIHLLDENIRIMKLLKAEMRAMKRRDMSVYRKLVKKK